MKLAEAILLRRSDEDGSGRLIKKAETLANSLPTSVGTDPLLNQQKLYLLCIQWVRCEVNDLKEPCLR